jgi:hypothetical protein
VLKNNGGDNTVIATAKERKYIRFKNDRTPIDGIVSFPPLNSTTALTPVEEVLPIK